MQKLAACLVPALCATAWADEASRADAERADSERARANYLLHCMGCHGEDGAGLEGKVPTMRGTLARIARTPEGRAYVMRVPGVTQSTLSAAELAEVLNWTLAEFSDAQALRAVKLFSAEEVAAYKRRPLLEVVATREAVLRARD